MSVKNLKTASDQIFDHYIRVGEIVSEKFSPYLEVIIHDLRDPEHSIIAIFNSHITGRKIGDGTSDIGYKKLANDFHVANNIMKNSLLIGCNHGLNDEHIDKIQRTFSSFLEKI